MSANIVGPSNVYDTYPNMYQQPTMFNPESNDLAGNRALLESNLVGGSKKRRLRKKTSKHTKGGRTNSKKNKKQRSRKSFYQMNK